MSTSLSRKQKVINNETIRIALEGAIKKIGKKGMPLPLESFVLTQEAKRQSFVPKKGIDFFTEEEIQEFAKMVLAMIVVPKDGTDGKDGANGKDGKDAPSMPEIKVELEKLVNKIEIPVAESPPIPVKGIDFFTESDVKDFVTTVVKTLEPEIEALKEQIGELKNTKQTTTVKKAGGGGNSQKFRTVTATDTMATRDEIIFADATNGSITLTLPNVSTAVRREYHIKKIDSSANTVTIQPQGSETIDGNDCYIITSGNTSIRLYSTGNNYFLI